MNVVHTRNYEEMSKHGVKIILEVIEKKKDAVICLATGSSPKHMYELLVQEINEKRIDISDVTFVKLDEWYGVDPQEDFTCTSFIRVHLLEKLYMQPKQIIEFQSNAKDIKEELHKVETYLEQHPIDVMILGLGMNGHLGLNEPAAELTFNCHLVTLSEKTQTHDMAKGHALTQGLTIGMKGIFDSHKIVMLVCGRRKEQAYEAFMSKRITTDVPASLLWLHSGCISIIDDEQFSNV